MTMLLRKLLPSSTVLTWKDAHFVSTRLSLVKRVPVRPSVVEATVEDSAVVIAEVDSVVAVADFPAVVHANPRLSS